MRAHLCILTLLFTTAAWAQDAREIMVRSVSHDDTNWFIIRDYTWQERTEERNVDDKGNVRSRESKVFDVVVIGGEQQKRLIARDDQPLAPKDAEKEQRKFDEAVAKSRKNEARHAAEQEKARARDRELLREIPKAYDFTLLGEEKVDGRDAWKIHAEPRPGYKPPNDRAKFLPKVHGTIWIEKATDQWCRVDIEIIEPLSFGLFLFRLNKGVTAKLDLKRVNDEVWLPERVRFQGSGKVALLKTIRADVEITYRDYRKFQSSSVVHPDLESAREP